MLSCAGTAGRDWPGARRVVLSHGRGGARRGPRARRARERDDHLRDVADDQGGVCDHEPVAADGVVGLAGPYDVTATGSTGRTLVGVDLADDPDAWTEGNPLTWVAERPGLPVLLLHGEADRVVPLSASRGALRHLREAGHDVTLVTLPDVDHVQVLRGEVVADEVVAWVRALAGADGS